MRGYNEILQTVCGRKQWALHAFFSRDRHRSRIDWKRFFFVRPVAAWRSRGPVAIFNYLSVVPERYFWHPPFSLWCQKIASHLPPFNFTLCPGCCGQDRFRYANIKLSYPIITARWLPLVTLNKTRNTLLKKNHSSVKTKPTKTKMKLHPVR